MIKLESGEILYDMEYYRLTCEACRTSYFAFYCDPKVLDDIITQHEGHEGFHLDGLSGA